MKIIPEVARKFGGKFPADYQNKLPYWGFFSKEEMGSNEGRLLMMDIDFGRYCSLDCPTCFRKSNVVDKGFEGDLKYDELLRVIDDARKLGLQSVKTCGAGEPTQDIRFLQFIKDMSKRDLGTAIFTKGQVLGDDKEAKRFNRNYGITSAQQLCDELAKYKVSFMLSFQSFDTEIQDKLVGKEGYSLVRNKALDNLVEADFNGSNPTRLALVNAPITQTNYNEAFEIYVYARERNLYPVFALSMVSGKQFDGGFLRSVDISYEQKLDLYVNIYSWNIEHGVQTLRQIQEEGVSAMPGVHPCNQIACGLYLTANGNVVGCPGFTNVEGNVREESIKNIWEKSQNRKLRAEVFNCKCPPKDGITIPHNIYEKVLKRLTEKYR
ncbi:MAG: radical SAM protein [Candidatus Pacearchaeota archaeon]